MKTRLSPLLLILIIAAAAPAVPVMAYAVQPTASATAALQRDRQAILGMAGDFRVKFDFRETVPFVAGYKPFEPKTSGGFEAVRVVEDKPGFISLQHLLVADIGGGETMVIKHWRQDWVYQPQAVLTYADSGRWTLTPVTAGERAGAWSQTVWQTDDSPRYGGVGKWTYDAGVTRWMSNVTARPLARRDAVRKPVYDHYVGTNRHALTPQGWVHEQDNAKVGAKDGKDVTFVHEVVLNTYVRSTDFPIKAADDYWAATKDYWATVRAAWDEAIVRGKGVAVAEEPENGSVTGPRLMGLADDIQAGKITTREAVAQARAVIASDSRLAAR